MPVEAAADTLTEVNIDLSRVHGWASSASLSSSSRRRRGLLKPNQNRYWQTVQAWVQVTQIGLDAFSRSQRDGGLDHAP